MFCERLNGKCQLNFPVRKLFVHPIITIIKFSWRYSSIEWICSKFRYNKEAKTLPNGIFWLLTVCASMFAFSNNLYQNSIIANENKISFVKHLASENYYRMFFNEIIKTYDAMETPTKPVLYNPFTNLKSLMGCKEEYSCGKEKLRELLDEIRFHLHNKDLVQIDINHIDISRADFRNSNLTLANLCDSSFFGADFSGANLAGAGAQHSNFRWAQFIESNLVTVSFENSYLPSTNFNDSTLLSTKFSNSYLHYASFKNADLSGAIFVNADLTRVDFTGAKHISAKQLLKAKSLYEAKIAPDIIEEIRAEKPELLSNKEFDKFLMPEQFWKKPLIIKIQSWELKGKEGKLKAG